MAKLASWAVFGYFRVYLVVGPGRSGQDFCSWRLSDDFEQKMNSVAQKLAKLAFGAVFGYFRVEGGVGLGRPGQTFS